MIEITNIFLIFNTFAFAKISNIEANDDKTCCEAVL